MDGKYCSLSLVLSLWNNVRICRYSSYKWNQGSDTFNPVWHHLLWIASHDSTLLLLSKESILSLRVVKKLEKGFIDTSFNDKHHRFAWELKLFGFLALRSFIKDTTTSITTKKQIQDYFLRKKEKIRAWCDFCIPVSYAQEELNQLCPCFSAPVSKVWFPGLSLKNKPPFVQLTWQWLPRFSSGEMSGGWWRLDFGSGF